MTTPAHSSAPPHSSAEPTGNPDDSRPRRLRIVDTPNSPVAPVLTEDATSATARSGATVDAARAPRVRPVVEVRPGALLAVCGLCGGAGASTLTYLIGAFAARHQPDDAVLACDTGGPSGGLAAYADVSAPQSLIELAELGTAGIPTEPPYLTTTESLRVLATPPRFTSGCPREGVERVLDQMRAAHALTVADCGTLAREVEQLVLTRASHVAWVLPATASGVRRAEQVLEAIDSFVVGRELVIVRRDARERQASLAEVKALAARRSDTLILVPHLPDLAKAPPSVALELAQVPLQAILGALQR